MTLNITIEPELRGAKPAIIITRGLNVVNFTSSQHSIHPIQN
ncbi:28336_t:CDS:1, partial [Dentiscutata erythropus]